MEVSSKETDILVRRVENAVSNIDIKGFIYDKF